MNFGVVHFGLAAGRHSQDRVAYTYSSERLVIVVADGAGGSTHGGEAATALLECVMHEMAHAFVPAGLVDLLVTFDSRLARGRGGDTTGVIVVVSEGLIQGASVGDSEAWLVHEGEILDLTSGQARKPLLGSGRATPQFFSTKVQTNDRIVVGTDGLFAYARPEAIVAKAREDDVVGLVDLVRLPSGNPPDDVSVVVARVL